MKRIRIAALCLAFLMVVCLFFTGCSAKKGSTEATAYQLVKSAVEKTQALDSCQLDMDLTIKTSLLGMEMEVPMNYKMKMAGLKSGDVRADGSIKMSAFGETADIGVYVDKQYVYVNTGEQKFKVKADATEAATYNVINTYDDMIQALPEDVLKDVTIQKADNGTRTVSVQLSEEKFNEVYKKFVSDVAEGALSIEETDSLNMKFANIALDISVNKDGYISEYKIAFDMDIKIGAEGLNYTQTVNISSDCRYIDPGKDVTVEAPDSSEYDEYLDFINDLLPDLEDELDIDSLSPLGS